MGLNSIKCPGYYQPFLASNHSTNKQITRMRPSAGNPTDVIDVGGGAKTGVAREDGAPVSSKIKDKRIKPKRRDRATRSTGRSEH